MAEHDGEFDGGLPLIGTERKRRLDEIMAVHVEALFQRMNTHKICVLAIQNRLDSYWDNIRDRNAAIADQKHHVKVDSVFMETLNTQIAVHLGAASQIAGTFALLGAQGVAVPLPAQDEGMAPSNGEHLN